MTCIVLLVPVFNGIAKTLSINLHLYHQSSVLETINLPLPAAETPQRSQEALPLMALQGNMTLYVVRNYQIGPSGKIILM